MNNEAMRKAFEDRFQDLPLDGVFWSEELGRYTAKEEWLVPVVDFSNDMFDVFKAGIEHQKKRTDALESILRKLLDNGDWFESAIELDVYTKDNVSGVELEKEAIKLIGKSEEEND